MGERIKVIAFLTGNVVMDSIKAVLLANLIPWPLAFYILSRWLRTFAYRISIAWWFFLLGGVLSVLITFLTVSYQSVKSARANPIDTLRNE